MRKRIAVAVVAFLLLCLGLAFARSRRAPDLIAFSTPFTAVSAEIGAYAWLDDASVLLMTDRAGPTQPPSLVVRRRDGSTRPLDDVNRFAADAGGLDINTLTVSPDREWLLFSSGGGQSCVTRLDGSQTARFPGGPQAPVWMDAGDTWADVLPTASRDRWRAQVIMRRAAEPTDWRSMRLATTGAPLGGAHGRLVLLADAAHGRPDSVLVVEPSVDGSLVGGGPLPVPAGWRVLDCSLAPHGTRIAIMLQHTYVPTLARWWAVLTRSKTGARPRTDTALWTCDLNGKGAREVARHTTDEGAPMAADFLLLRWTPDGKRISFVYQDDIRVCPAD